MEFDDRDERSELSINLPVEEFMKVMNHSIAYDSDELAYAEYLECLEEQVDSDLTEGDLFNRRSILYEYIGDIERRRGDFEMALASYGLARANAEVLPDPMGSPARKQGDLLLHELERPADAVEPYEKVKEIADSHRKLIGGIVSNEIFNNYSDLLGHLAAAYQAANDFDKLRELNRLIMTRGGLTPAIFGYGTCHHQKHGIENLGYETPLYREIKEIFMIKPDEIAKEDKQTTLDRVISLEELVNDEAFMAHVPEQRDNVIMSLHHLYACLQPGSEETGERLKAAIKLARQHGFVAHEATLQLQLALNQNLMGWPDDEAFRTLSRAFEASVKCLKQGVSLEHAYTEPIVKNLEQFMDQTGDLEGIDKLRGRLGRLGIGSRLE